MTTLDKGLCLHCGDPLPEGSENHPDCYWKERSRMYRLSDLRLPDIPDPYRVVDLEPCGDHGEPAEPDSESIRCSWCDEPDEPGSPHIACMREAYGVQP